MLTASDPCFHVGKVPQGRTDSNPDIRAPELRPYFFCKRLMDASSALVLLVLTAPVILIAMVLVKLTSRGPALYSQTRLGWHGRPFIIFKLRTMAHECESLTGARWCTPGDARITPVGRWLRKTHIDELPQLWNVLRGDMSLIGPRPERPEFVPRLEQAIRRYRERLLVRPGVSGLAQVQLPPDTDLGSVRVKLAYDLYYVQRVGLGLDLRLCMATIFKMANLPFRVIRRAFGFPTRQTVESDYARLLAAPPSDRRSANAAERNPCENDPVPVLS